jgi:hypothetical protein
VSFACDESDLLAVNWHQDNLSADFILPGVERRAVRVRFTDAAIVRGGGGSVRLSDYIASSSMVYLQNGIEPHHWG